MAKKLREKIKDLEERYRYLSDNLLDSIWVMDADRLKFEYITPSTERISGYTIEEHLNLTLKDRLTPESFHKIEKILAEERRGFERGIKTIRKMELEWTHKDGSVYWVEIRAKFYKEEGESLKIVGISRDISEQKKIEQQQTDLIKKLGEALAEKNSLLQENKILRGLLPICSGCRRIRDENNRWWPLDAYVKKKTEAEFTHTICPDCQEVFYGDI